jgi:hypothetical protein
LDGVNIFSEKNELVTIFDKNPVLKESMLLLIDNMNNSSKNI